MGAMILIFAFMMSLIINFFEKMAGSNNEEAATGGETVNNLATEPSE